MCSPSQKIFRTSRTPPIYAHNRPRIPARIRNLSSVSCCGVPIPDCCNKQRTSINGATPKIIAGKIPVPGKIDFFIRWYIYPALSAVSPCRILDSIFFPCYCSSAICFPHMQLDVVHAARKTEPRKDIPVVCIFAIATIKLVNTVAIVGPHA